MKYKPAINDVIKFTRGGGIHVGAIRWIASSGFLLIKDHDIPIKNTAGDVMDCDIFIEATDIIGEVIVSNDE